MAILRGHRCERAREWASLRVDGELSELEGRLLDDHLARCGDCSTFASAVGAQAAALRGAPLVPFRAELTLPTRRRVPVRSLSLAAAAMAAASLVAVGSLEFRARSEPALRAPHVSPAATPDDFVGVNIARRAKLIADTPHFWVGPRGFQLT